ncbi:MAG: hypothetical protein EOP09_12480 [Proteobacteria bacterium]|nr:MAG: hypothetical protein EOP09_12480 [Pseudomonadota bacterium]
MVILRKLDIARDQVFVETVIMEMGMSDSNNWGIGYYKFGKGGGKTGFSSGVNLADVLNPAAGTGATLGFGSGDTVDIVTDLTAGTSVKIPSLIGFINFIKTQGKGNILSTPQILALDNQTAEIEVGDKIATSITTSTTATGTTSSANFEEATIKLIIKPFISPASETIRMEVDQKISQLTTISNSPKALTDNSQPLAKRSIKTTLVVRNKDTAVLGGLMKDTETEEISKVPLLGDLPIIGWLFKSRKGLKTKTNLLVFLTPTIIRNPADQKSNVDDMLDRRLKYIKAQGGRDPYGETVDRLAKKPVTPVDDNGGE